MFMPHFQLQLKSSLKLTLADIDLTINENQIHMFILLIKSPVSHAANDAVLQTGMIFRSIAEKIQVLSNFWHRAEILLLRVGGVNPEDREET